MGNKAGTCKGSLTVDGARRAYTVWSAYAAFREAQTGMIARGRWGDLTVMDIDPFVVAGTAPDRVLGGRITLPVVGGRVCLSGRGT